MNAVLALRVAGYLWVRGLFGFGIVMRAAVVHAEPVAIAENGVIGAGVAFPRRIGGDHDLLWYRSVQVLLGITGELANELSINE